MCLSEPLLYLMTRSASTSTDHGIVSPSFSAVCRLMTSSNFIGCSTGRPTGLAPRSIRSSAAAA
jgi:hypothetical protein